RDRSFASCSTPKAISIRIQQTHASLPHLVRQVAALLPGHRDSRQAARPDSAAAKELPLPRNAFAKCELGLDLPARRDIPEGMSMPAGRASPPRRCWKPAEDGPSA